MKSFLLAGITAFAVAGLTTGCESSSTPPAQSQAGAGAAAAGATAGAKPGTDGPLNSGVKPVKGRFPKAP